MEDELTRARRALRVVDPELDPSRVHDAARLRVREAPAVPDAGEHVVLAEVVEVRLHTPVVPRSAPTLRHRRVLVWGAVAASAVLGLVWGPSTVDSPVRPAAPVEVPPAVVGSADPSPRPTAAADAVDRAAHAMAAERICLVRTHSVLGSSVSMREDRPLESRVDRTLVPLSPQPALALQEAAVEAVLRLGAEPDTGTREVLGTEELDGREAVRVRTTGAEPELLDGVVTRVEHLIDTTTWLPLSQELRARSDAGESLMLRSEFEWLGCTESERSPH